MSKKRGISRLLHDLYELYYKLCAIDLRKRLNLYHRNTDAHEVPDISASLSKHFDKLAPTSKPNSTGTASNTKSIASKRPGRTDNEKQSSTQPQGIIKAVSTVIRPQNTFTKIKSSNQNMGEKLKDSTWTHLHAATLQARQGNAIKAKLHAGIADDALKEAASYLTDEDYKVLCEEVTRYLELEEQG